MSGGKFPTTGIFARRSLVKRPAAVWITPPPVPEGEPTCSCCSGPLEAGVCIPCEEAVQGRPVDPTVTRIEGVPGRGWRKVKFVRRHRVCPLRLGFEGTG